MPIKQEEVIISDETNHGNNLAQQGILRAVSTLLLQPWWRKLVYPLFCISGLGRTFKRMQQNGLQSQRCEIQPVFKNQRAGNLQSTSLSIGKNNLARTAEISHLRVIWLAVRRNAFWQFPHSFVKLLLSGKEQSARSPCRWIPWLFRAHLIQSNSVFI